MKRLASLLMPVFLLAPAPAVIAAEQAGSSASNSIEQGDPARVQLAASLVEKLDVQRTVDTMLNDLKGLFADNAIAAIERENRDFFQTRPGGRERFNEILGEEFLVAMRARYPDLKKMTAQQYASFFTAQELQELQQFFSSGVGSKWLNVSPQLEGAMSKWGESAGTMAGAEAFVAALKRADAEQNNTQQKGSK